jgi:hypothetical protein
MSRAITQSLQRTYIADGEVDSREISIGEKIGSGRHGIVHKGTFRESTVCLKRYPGQTPVINYARNEFLRLQAAHRELPDISAYLQEGIGWVASDRHGPMLVSRLVTNFDGSVSGTLDKETAVDRHFYDVLDQILKQFSDNGKLYNPVSTNILVKKTSPEQSVPVFIDLTNYENYWHYPLMLVSHTLFPGSKQTRIREWAKHALASCAQKVCDR